MQGAIAVLTILIIVLFIWSNSVKFEGFSEKLNFLQETELKKLLKIIHENFTDNKIPYAIFGDTLDAAIKYKDIDPSAEDVDIIIFDHDKTKIEKIDWAKSGCVLHSVEFGYRLSFIDGKPASKKEKWNFPFVNIHISRSQESDILPRKKYQIGDLLLFGPVHI